MKSLKFARLAAIAAVASLSAAAFAGTGSVVVTATLAPQCKFTSVGAMSFTLDPSTGSNATSNATPVVIHCTNGTPVGTFTVGSGAEASTNGSYASGTAGALVGTGTNTDKLQYSVTWTAPSGSGTGFGGTGITVDLNGTIAAAQFANATPDTYTKNLAISITP